MSSVAGVFANKKPKHICKMDVTDELLLLAEEEISKENGYCGGVLNFREELFTIYHHSAASN